MDDKKIILNKTEFDSMETELNNLRLVVLSKTICKIAVPRLTWSHIHGGCDVNSYDVKYVVGCDENETVKELSDEVKKLQKEKQELNQIIDSLEAELRWHNNQKDEWKNLPWYKRLFV